MLRRVLVGFDGSRDALEALRVGAALAADAGGELAVALVVSASHGETDEDREAAFRSDSEPLRAAAERALETAVSPALERSVSVLVGDHPATALSSYAERRGFDVLVVGRHGRERAGHAGLGRVARELADKARCPLLLVGDGHLDGE